MQLQNIFITPQPWMFILSGSGHLRIVAYALLIRVSQGYALPYGISPVSSLTQATHAKLGPKLVSQEQQNML